MRAMKNGVMTDQIYFDGVAGKFKISADVEIEAIDTLSGNMTALSLTVDGINTRVSNTEGSITELTQTVNSFELRITNAEGDVASAILKADAIELAVNNTKVTIDDVNGVIIKNGGFKVTGSFGDTFTVNSSTGAVGIFGNLKTGSGNRRNEIADGVISVYAENTTPQGGGYKCGSIYGYYYRWGLNPYTASLILNGNNEVAIKLDVSGSPEYHLTSAAHNFTGNIVAFGKTFNKTKAGNALTSSDYVMVAN